MTRARLGRYAVWQMSDYFTERGASAAIIGVLLGVLGIETARAQYGAAWASGTLGVTVARHVVQQMSSPFAFIAVVVSIQGIVANDRKMGYYRFLFAKPLSVPRYYAQSFVVNGLALGALTAALLGVYAFAVRPVDPRPTIAIVAIHYAILGGLTFLMSALVRFDWLAAGALWLLGSIVRALYGGSGLLAYRIANVVLPPAHKVDGLAAALFGDAPMPGSDLAWVVGYGALCFVAGLVVLRWRALAE